MKNKILKSIDFDAVTPLNESEMSLLVGGRGGSWIAVVISIAKDLLEGNGSRNGNCSCPTTNNACRR